jgi:hypothetical protein
MIPESTTRSEYTTLFSWTSQPLAAKPSMIVIAVMPAPDSAHLFIS